ncbi:MAG: hypothetical protein J6J43_00220, partial [Oscillospiraceae bacterium]|nr:hypothetical protein [Oscillospiraceae bacterium]
MAHIVPYYNASRNFFDVSVTVAEAGYYKLGLNAYTEPAATQNDDPTTGTKQGGTNAFNFKVNGEVIVDVYNSGASPKGTFTDKSLGVVYLNEGANTITMGTNSLTRHGYLNGYTLTKVEQAVEVGTEATVDLAALELFSDETAYTYEATVDGAAVSASVADGVLTLAAEEVGEAVVTVSNGTETYDMAVSVVAAEMSYDCQPDADGICTECGYDTNCYHEGLTTVAIDFKEMAKEAAKQDFWADLPTYTSKSGTVEIKGIGLNYGTSMDDTQKAASEAFFAWVEANYGWSFNNTKSLFTSTVGNRLFICADDSVAWGIDHWCYHVNHQSQFYRDSMYMDITVEEAGTYRLDVTAYLNNTSDTSYADTTAMASGGGQVDIYVNDVLVYDNYIFSGANTVETATFATVELKAGANTVQFKTVNDINGAAAEDAASYLTRTNVMLVGLNAIKADVTANGNGTHTVGTVCADCGEVFIEETTEACTDADSDNICDVCGYDSTCYHTDLLNAVDFQSAVQAFAAQEPEHWANIPNAVEGVDTTKKFGADDLANATDAEKAAYAAFVEFMANEYGVSLANDIYDTAYYRLYLNANEKAGWGLAFYPASLAWSNGSEANNKLYLTVDAAADGYYKLDLGMVQHTSGNASASKIGTLTGANSGCGTIDVRIDGELVIDDYVVKAADYADVVLDLGTVFLTEGEHQVSVHVITDNNDAAYGAGGRRMAVLNGLSITALTTESNDDFTHTVSATCICGEVLVESFTENCSDENADEACDICGASMVCTHKGIEVSAINFKEMVMEAAKQDFWADLTTLTSKDGNYEIKAIGEPYGTNISDTAKAAALAFFAWVEANYDWSFNNDVSLFTSNIGNRLFLCADPAVKWGVDHWCYYVNHAEDRRDSMVMDLVVEEAGLYQLDLTAYLANTNDQTYPVTTGPAAAGGKVDIYVNDVLVYDNFDFGGANTVESFTIANVVLKAGTNTVKLKTVDDYGNANATNGNAYLTRTNAMLVELSATKAEAVSNEDGTHVVGLTCADCGTVIIPEETQDCVDISGDMLCDVCGYDLTCAHEGKTVVAIDFKALAKQIAEQDFWATLNNVDDDTKYTGITTYMQSMTEAQKAAYDALLAYIADNTDWAINDEMSDLRNPYALAKLYLDASDAAQWGISWYPGGFDTVGKDSLAFDVEIAEAGWYELDIDSLKESSTSVSATGLNAGGSYVDIYVNGALAADNHFFGIKTVAERVDEKIAVVYLNEGTNTIQLRAAASYQNETSSGRRLVNLCGIELVKLDIAANEDLTHTLSCVCPVCDADLAEAVTEACFDNNYDATCDVCGNAVELSAYEINTEADLIEFAYYVNAGAGNMDANLNADITLTAKWINATLAKTTINKAIGTKEVPYSGTFNGNGYTISGLDIYYSNHSGLASGGNELTNDTEIGLFGVVDGATIKDLTVEGAIALSGRQGNSLAIGGVVAEAYDLTITDVLSRVTITGNGNYQWGTFSNVGGVVGYAEGLTMTRCANEAAHHVMGNGHGGLVGKVGISDAQTVISESYNTGKIEGTMRVGGLVGILGGCTNEATPTTLTNCYSVAEVNVYRLNNNDISEELYNFTYHGGMIGYVDGLETTDTYLHAANSYVVYTTINPAVETTDEYTAVVGGAAASDGLIPSLYATGTYENLYYACDNRTSPSDTATQKTVEEMKTAEFAATLGAAFKDAADDRTAILAWQDDVCAHDYTSTTVEANGDDTHTVSEICNSCGAVISSSIDECSDENTDNVCDICDAVLNCKHENLSTSYIGNGDGTHEKSVTCADCGEAQGEAVIEDCADEDGDGYCDGCEDPVEAACDHAETTSETVYNGDKTHTTTVTCVCGEVVSTETADCVDEDKDCACDTCGGVIKTVTKTTVAGSNMNLGNELQVNFIINDPKVAGDYVAYIHQDTDDEGGVTYEIPSSDWEFFSTGRSKVGVR